MPELAEELTLGPEDVVEPPRILDRPEPRYPPHLRERGIEGRAVARGIVGRDGRFREIEIVEADHPALVEPLLDLLRQMRFEPATVNGRPVAVYHTMTQRLVLP